LQDGRESPAVAAAEIPLTLQKLRVMISMELEGVTDVRPADDEFEYLFNVRKVWSTTARCGERWDQSDDEKDDLVRAGS
jgi:hypothetical protein